MDLLPKYCDPIDYMYFYFEGDNRTYTLYEKMCQRKRRIYEYHIRKYL